MRFKILIVVAVLVLLSMACSGGGGGVTPTPSWTPSKSLEEDQAQWAKKVTRCPTCACYLDSTETSMPFPVVMCQPGNK